MPPSRYQYWTADYRQHCNKWLWYDAPYAEADQLRSLVRLKGDTTYGDHVCLRLSGCLPQMPGLTVASKQAPTQKPNPANTGSASTQNSRPTPPVYLQGYSFGRVKQSSSQPSQLPASSNTSTSPQQAPGPATVICLPQQFYILLGARRGRRSLEMGQLDHKMASDDEMFFVNLKAEYRQLSGSLRCWFSIWQLSHCDFVKVCLTAIFIAHYLLTVRGVSEKSLQLGCFLARI